MKLLSLKKIAGLLMMTACCASLHAQDSSQPLKNYEVTGDEALISDIPVINGRWYNSRGQASQTFKIDGGELSMWSSPQCGRFTSKVQKFFQNAEMITIEAGPPANQFRCGSEHGIAFIYNKNTKQGSYFVRGSKEDRSIANYGRIVID